MLKSCGVLNTAQREACFSTALASGPKPGRDPGSGLALIPAPAPLANAAATIALCGKRGVR